MDEPTAPAACGDFRDHLAAGVWWGLVGGALEVAAHATAQAIRPRVTVDSIRTNHHHLWMVPASNILILGSVGLALAILARFAPGFARRVSTPILATLASLGAIRVIPELRSPSGLILALGLGAVALRTVASREPGFRRLVRCSLVPALAVLAAWTGYHANRVAGSEGRALAALPAAAPGAKNVLLIVMDNVRADDLSLYGYARDTSPNLKRLAARGVRFDRARSTASWTLPSHASMLTGRWPHELSVSVDSPLDGAKPTLAEVLAARGYVTAGFVANTYYCNSWYGLDRGFSRYEDFAVNRRVSFVETLRSGGLGKMLTHKLPLATREGPGQPWERKTASRISGDFLGWLDARGGRPFFAFLNYFDAHEPFQPPTGSPRRFGLSALPEGERDATMSLYAKIAKRKPGTPSTDPAADAAVIARGTQLLHDSYDDCIASLDAQVGRLLDELDRRGLKEDTLVILTSDHGEELGEKTMMGHGVSVYRPEVHVPLVILPPGPALGGRVVPEPASLRDLPATVLDLLGHPDPGPFPGASLSRFWTTQGAESGPVLSEVEHQKKFAPSRAIPASLGPIAAIVEGRHVYIRNADGREEIYDLESDPGESKNLADLPENAPLVARLSHKLDRAAAGGTEPEASRIVDRAGKDPKMRR